MKSIFLLACMLYSLITVSKNPPVDIDKILKSGNGLSIETAFQVNTVDEEYDLLRYMKLTPILQKLQIKDGYFYDAIQTQTNIVYFKIIKRQLPKKANIKTRALIL